MTTTSTFTVTLTGLPANPVPAGSRFTVHVHVTASIITWNVPLTGAANDGVAIVCPGDCVLQQVGPFGADQVITLAVPQNAPAGTVALAETAGNWPVSATVHGTFTVAKPKGTPTPQPTVTRTFTRIVTTRTKTATAPRAAAPAVAAPQPSAEPAPAPSATDQPLALPSVTSAPARATLSAATAPHTHHEDVSGIAVVAFLLAAAVTAGLLAVWARRNRRKA